MLVWNTLFSIQISFCYPASVTMCVHVFFPRKSTLLCWVASVFWPPKMKQDFFSQYSYNDNILPKALPRHARLFIHFSLLSEPVQCCSALHQYLISFVPFCPITPRHRRLFPTHESKHRNVSQPPRPHAHSPAATNPKLTHLFWIQSTTRKCSTSTEAFTVWSGPSTNWLADVRQNIMWPSGHAVTWKKGLVAFGQSGLIHVCGV